MIDAIQNLVRATDDAVAHAYLSCFRERPAIRCFLFHSLFRDESEIDGNVVDFLQRTTVEQFRQFILYYLDCGYVFVTPRDVLAGLAPDRQYALITFDDGYFSNSLALPVMQSLNVPAAFYIATEHVRSGMCFWWDVLHRERHRLGASTEQIHHEALSLKSLTTEAIHAKLSAQFGSKAFDPIGDIDRPFTTDELRAFAASPLVEVGNHTTHHTILTNYTPAEAGRSIAAAQAWLTETLGTTPVSIAYPNGGVNASVVKAAKDAGLKIGFTTRPHKNELAHLHAADFMEFGRFCLHGEAPFMKQCKTCRSDLLIYSRLRQLFVNFRPGGGRS